MLQIMCSSASKTALFYLANIPRYYRNNVACFTSASNKLQGDINVSRNLREGTAGSYDTSAGMPNVDNNTKLGRRREEEDAAELGRAGAAAAVETGLKVGEMTKQTVDGVWDAAKRTAENVRDSISMVGDDDEKQQQPIKEEAVKDIKQQGDKHVEDLRRRAGGYDLDNP